MRVRDSPLRTVGSFFRVIWFIQKTKWTSWLGKRFVYWSLYCCHPLLFVQ